MILDKNDKSFLKKFIASDSSYMMINEKGDSQFKCLSCSCPFYIAEDFGLKPCHNELVINKFPPSDEEKRAIKKNDQVTLKHLRSIDPMLEIYALCKKCDSDYNRKMLSIEKLREKRKLRFVSTGNKRFVKSFEKVYNLQPGHLLRISFPMGKFPRSQEEALWGSGGIVVSNLRKSEVIYFIGAEAPALSKITYWQLAGGHINFE
jgi:hypothetical protein